MASPGASLPLSKRSIAARYLPSRYHYWYALSKLATDPLYVAVRSVLAGTHAPLLDVGCGIGLLPQYLRASGIEVEYWGADIDAGKIEIARAAAAKSGSRDVRFEVVNVAQVFPEHRGSVALLDVLQYFEADARDALLRRAASCITPGGRLIVRAGLDDRNWRAAITRGADKLGHLARWMQTPPRSQPSRDALEMLLAAAGLHCEFRSLSGNTPFNNWLIVGSRRTA